MNGHWRNVRIANARLVNGRFRYTFRPTGRGTWRVVGVVRGQRDRCVDEVSLVDERAAVRAGELANSPVLA